ncbi:hypothetical protein CDN99_24080 [Roseateles aquatilis]|uniref:Uncharacterized protein n=1 Tax=Roseateles aquatilis TaxID=431061 RepID=A0A246IWF3_9BURK|nr:hypothetical protein [Roseateles aquatilis]OWQ84377.1 hypothetical protein CDN99_24080 [Roseateles aquatilis]
MSDDLMVFDPDPAPKDRDAFLAWYQEQAEWGEDHSYDDPEVSTSPLRAWFLDMIQSYPAMNGPHASEDIPEDDTSVTDYSVGKVVIYAAFAWSLAEQAHEATFRLAAKHGVGFLDASSDNAEVWLPDGKGGLSLAHSG